MVRKREPYCDLSASSIKVADGVIIGTFVSFMNLETEGALALYRGPIKPKNRVDNDHYDEGLKNFRSYLISIHEKITGYLTKF